MTNEQKQNKGRSLSTLVGTVTKYTLAFEGLTRIAEANLPQEYAEVVSVVRSMGEIAVAGSIGLGAMFMLNPIGALCMGSLYYNWKEGGQTK